MGSEAVISTVLMLVGENSRIVANRASDKLAEVNRALPPDVFAEPVYNRSKLVNATIATVRRIWSKAPCWSSSCCSCCWATSAPR
jgi:cobalt-zinc-cadmium resistance protein CzcA